MARTALKRVPVSTLKVLHRSCADPPLLACSLSSGVYLSEELFGNQYLLFLKVIFACARRVDRIIFDLALVF